jgi:hypothetical protein
MPRLKFAMKPDEYVMISGQPKSGTTWLEYVTDLLAKEACKLPENDCIFRNEDRKFRL